MGGSIRIARLFGIGIYIHWSFWFIIAYVLYLYLSQGRGVTAAIEGVVFVFAIFACVVLHELGHSLAARRYNIPTKDITLLPIGGVARLARMPTNPWQEFVVAIAGPLVNVAIAGIVGAALLVLGKLSLDPDVLMSVGATSFLNRLVLVNLFLVGFNMIPAFPMDGGRVLRAVLGMLGTPYESATRAAAIIGKVFAVGFAILGILVVNPFLLLIALFVFLGAGAEANSARFTALLDHARVRDAAMTDFDTLPAGSAVSDAAQALIDGSQTEFPVVDERGIILGIVTQDRLLRALAEGRAADPLSTLTLQNCPDADASEPLTLVYERMRSSNCPAIMVTDAGSIVGMLTADQVAEYMMIRRAVRQASRQRR